MIVRVSSTNLLYYLVNGNKIYFTVVNTENREEAIENLNKFLSKFSVVIPYCDVRISSVLGLDAWEFCARVADMTMMRIYSDVEEGIEDFNKLLPDFIEKTNKMKNAEKIVADFIPEDSVVTKQQEANEIQQPVKTAKEEAQQPQPKRVKKQEAVAEAAQQASTQQKPEESTVKEVTQEAKNPAKVEAPKVDEIKPKIEEAKTSVSFVSYERGKTHYTAEEEKVRKLLQDALRAHYSPAELDKLRNDPEGSLWGAIAACKPHAVIENGEVVLRKEALEKLFGFCDAALEML